MTLIKLDLATLTGHCIQGKKSKTQVDKQQVQCGTMSISLYSILKAAKKSTPFNCF